jgi:7-cyano-7-deazaguanine synthase
MMASKAVVLHSGGLDSSTVLYIAAKQDNQQVYPISFLYGQKHFYELECARKVAESLGSVQKVAHVGLRELVKSALLGSSDIPSDGVKPGEIPSTWVPQRNAIFLALAYAYAEMVGADWVYGGMNAIDYSGYPDCRPEFLLAIEKALNLASKRFVETGKAIRLVTPLVKMSKADIIRTGLRLEVPYNLTWSCYKGPDELNRACSTCDSCRIRLQAFQELGVKDPIQYVEVKE